jgi:heme oxygenase (biliverdin-IX-beta and delta-forming)
VSSSVALSGRANQSDSAIAILRDATKVVHEQLHAHRVFAVLQTGRIDLSSYINLLLALYGFHQGFAGIAADGSLRCQRLIDDLCFVGADAARIEQAPRLAAPSLPTAAERWGVDYVLRGASLGGRVLGRQLDPLLGRGNPGGRSFFLNGGEDSGAQWRIFVAQLEHNLPLPVERQVAAAAAVATFAQFERWMTQIVTSRQT